MPHQDESDQELHELLTVDEVAALLKVSKSWVYEHTRRAACRDRNGCPTSRSESTCGFDTRAVRDFSGDRSKIGDSSSRPPATMSIELQHEEPTRGKDVSDGSKKTTVRKRLSAETRKGVGDSLAGDRDCSRRHDEAGAAVRSAGRRDAEAGARLWLNNGGGRSSKTPTRSRVTFRTLASEWQATCCRCTSTRRRSIVGSS